MVAVATPAQSASVISTPGKVKSRKGSRRSAGTSVKNVEGTRATKRQPTEAELVAAVESLCHDELRPYGRLIRKRLAELASATDADAPDADLAALKRLCDSSCKLIVEMDGEADWSAVVDGTSAEFIDIYGGEDNYAEEMWSAFASYLEGIEDEGTLKPGGRYVCAQGLISQNLSFFEGYTLGRVSHIVQIAMSTRKLLGYKNGAIVPYALSETAAKEQCAEHHGLMKKAKSPLATWDALRSSLREVLEDARDGGFPLSNVKRILRTRFKIDLSETALGHATVTELFKDPRIQDLCSVRLLDNGYFLFPEFEAPEVPEVSTIQLDPMPSQAIFSTTPYVIQGTTDLVNIPGASTFNTLESQASSAAWDLMCNALDMNPRDVYPGAFDVSHPFYANPLWCGSIIEPVPTHEEDLLLNLSPVKTIESEGEKDVQDVCDESAEKPEDVESACGSTIGSTRESSRGGVSSSSSELENSFTLSSLPSTPLAISAVTPSPSPWTGGGFANEFRAAIEEASKSTSKGDDEGTDADSSVACHGNQDTEWPLPEIKVKNTFIEIDSQSPTPVATLRAARQARSLPTTPWTLGKNDNESEQSATLFEDRECVFEFSPADMGGKDQSVFQWGPAAIEPDAKGGLCLTVKNTFLNLNSPAPDDESQDVDIRSKSCPMTPLIESGLVMGKDGASVADSGGSTHSSPQPNTKGVFQWSSALAALATSANQESQDSNDYSVRNTFIHIPSTLSPGVEGMFEFRSLPASPCFLIGNADLQQNQKIAVDNSENASIKEGGNQPHELIKGVRFGSFEGNHTN